MSVRAYRLLRETVERNGKVYVAKMREETETFNVWHHDRIFWLIADYGYDYTNEDCCGEIGIELEDWQEMKDRGDLEKFDDKEEIEILQEIDNILKQEGEISFECF